MKKLTEMPFRRTGLVWYLQAGKCTKGAEIGVYKGDYAKSLLNQMPDLELYLVDLWKHQDSGYIDGANAADDIFEPMYQMVTAMFKDKPNVKILRMSSVEALDRIPDGYLDFVYIDANHSYEAAKADINNWAKKVRSKGFVCGDDYGFAHPGVIQAVNEFDEELIERKAVSVATDSTWMFMKK